MATQKIIFFIVVAFIPCITSQVVRSDELKIIGNANDDQHMKRVLNKILIPRVAGTLGHEQVKSFIVQELKSLGLYTELDTFKANTSLFGEIEFTNIVGKLNRNADNYLTLACHYDSKYFKNFEFLAATDSAVPCAMMLNVVKTLAPFLDQVRNRTDISLMLIFFDGEEAFYEWSESDSLYGSRNLANKWNNEITTNSLGRALPEITKIRLLALIDLVGAPNQRFVSFFQNTHKDHLRLFQIERFLGKQRLLTGSNYMFSNRYLSAQIDDDHKPFLHRGVPVLHLIATPFPSVWHTKEDNGENLSWTTINNFNKILRIFVYDYFVKFSL